MQKIHNVNIVVKVHQKWQVCATLENALGAHATHATVLGLPRKKIQQRSKGLPNQTEAHPKDAIPNRLAQGISHLLQGRREGN